MSTQIFSAKAFMSYGALVNNNEREVALLGELSVYAQTFARDRLLFGRGSGGPTNTAVRASVFSSKLDGVPTEFPAEYGNYLAQMGSWIYTQANDGRFNANVEVFRQALAAEFSGAITNVTVGPVVQQGIIYLPEHVTFELIPDAVFIDAYPEYLENTRIKIWFSDRAFVSQYDEYNYEFIAPLDNLDDFFRVRTQVEADVKRRSQTELFQRITALTDRDPSTGIINEMYEFRDPDDALYRFDTNWVIIYYGAAGNNIDAIKEELTRWILANSTHTREEWAEIFPDIFTSTEFIITPMWTTYAIPNKTNDPGMYSPTVLLPYAQTVSRGTCLGTNYSQAHIDANTAVLNTTYKSLGALITGGPDNRDGLTKFFDVYRDYIAVPTSSTDFDRMAPMTRGWVERLYELLFAAESMTDYSDVPQGMTRLRRRRQDGQEIMYVVASYNNIQYLVVTKQSMNIQYPPADLTPLSLTVNGHDGVTSLDAAYAGDTYETRFVAKGGVGPYTYSLQGARPDQLTSWEIDPVTGEFVALISHAGLIDVPVRVMDEENRAVDVRFHLHIEAPGT